MKRLEHLEAAKAEAIKLGATISFEKGRKHIIATLTLNNQTRKLAISGTPKKMCTYHVVDDIRRLIRTMQNVEIVLK